MAIQFQTIVEGSNYYAVAGGGARFFVGRRTKYQNNVGLYNIFAGSPLQSLNYVAANYVAEFGFWAEFIDPTAECEGRSFLTLNTYDRAAFTFGFTQFAAHVPNGDFVQFFRGLLARPEAADYFPKLGLRNGRIARIDGAQPVPLESDTTTQPLMTYLNPTLQAVEDQEVICAARLIHWTSNVRAVRLAQIRGMIDAYRTTLEEADRRGLIEGRTADLCCVIADIIHQGRGTWKAIGDALRSSAPFDNLVAIGSAQWNPRKAVLRARILANPHFRTKHWNGAVGDFL